MEIVKTLATQNVAFSLILGAACLMLGFVIAQLVLANRSQPMHRTQYVFWTSLQYFVVVCVSVVWAIPVGRFDPSVMGIASIVAFALLAGVGFFLGLSARARSISLTLKAGFSVLALIPVANVIFAIFKPHQAYEQDENHGPLSGIAGIAGAVVLLAITGGIFQQLWIKGDTFSRHSPKIIARANLIEEELQSGSLGDVLWRMASDIPQNTAINDDLILRDVTSNEKAINYAFEFTANAPLDMNKYLAQQIDDDCEDPIMRVLIDAGTNVERTYNLNDGSELGAITVNSQHCQPNNG